MAINSRIDNETNVIESKFIELINKARELNLFLYGRRFGMEFWFSPKEFSELALKNSNWVSKIEWTLRDPRERTAELKNYIDLLNQEITDLKTAMYLEEKENRL